MSTADSSLNAASVAFTNDLFFPLFKRLTEKHKLLIVRNLTYLLGLLCILVSLSYNILFEVEIIYNSLWFSTTLVPLYFCIFNRKIHTSSFILCLGIGFSFMLAWNYYLKAITHIDGVFPGFLANLCCFVFFYFRDGRQKIFADVRNEGLLQTLALKDRPPFPFPDHEVRRNIVLGIFLLATQIVPMIFLETPTSTTKACFSLINGGMAILLIFGHQFPNFYRKYFSSIEELALFLCLPTTSIYLLFSADNSCLHLANFGLSILLINLLSKDRYSKITMGVSIFMTVLVAAGCCFSLQVLRLELHWFHVFYLMSFFFVLFAVWLQRHTFMTERYAMVQAMAHDLMTPMMVQKLIITHNDFGHWPKEEYRLFVRSLEEMLDMISSIVPRSPIPYEALGEDDLGNLTQGVLDQKLFLYKTLQIHLEASESMKVRVDSTLFYRVMNNLINLCLSALHPDATNCLTIRLTKTSAGNPTLTILNEPQGLLFSKIRRSIATQDSSDKCYGPGIGFASLQRLASGWRAELSLHKLPLDRVVCKIQFPPAQPQNAPAASTKDASH
jgi:hypothetical protein